MLTVTIAFVRSLHADSAATGSRHSVSSISANTTRAPRRAALPAVEKNVNGVVTTSSPGPMPIAMNVASSASVPDNTTS